MTELFGTGAGSALAIFGLVVLGVISLALLWQGWSELSRQRKVSKKLDELSGRKGGAGAAEESTGGLLREEERREVSWLEPLLLRLPHRQDFQHRLEQADVDWSVGTYLVLTAGLGAAAGLAVFTISSNVILAVVGLGLAGAAPTLYVKYRKKKRLDAFEEQFPDAVDLLGRSLRAGHALNTGIQVVSQESPSPVADEFRQVFEEQRYGLPLRESLLSLADRVDLVDVRMFVTSVMIQRESGGNLAENLDNLARITRQRFKFQRDLRTMTAQGRLTGYIVAAAPFVAGLGMYMMDPDYLGSLWEAELGRWMLGGALAMQVMGFFIIRRIVDIEY